MPLIAACALLMLAAVDGGEAEPARVEAPEAEPGPVPGGELGVVTQVTPPSPSQTSRFDAVVALNAMSPASNVETTVAPWLGLRVGTLAPARDAASMGFDAALFLGQVKDGTPQVSTTRTVAFIEGRGLFAPTRFASTFSALVPYAFLGASAGGGMIEVRAFEDARIRPLFTWATRAGLGGELQVHALTTRLELGAGLRDLRAELTSALSLGVAF